MSYPGSKDLAGTMFPPGFRGCQIGYCVWAIFLYDFWEHARILRIGGRATQPPPHVLRFSKAQWQAELERLQAE